MKILFVMFVALCAVPAFAQLAPNYYALTGEHRLDGAPEPRLLSNVIIDIKPIPHPQSDGDFMWLGTGNGLSRVASTLPGTLAFRSYTANNGLGKGGASALVVTDSIIWSAFAFDTTVGVSGAGGGLAYSRNRGTSWTFVPQPRDPRVSVDANGYSSLLGYWPTTTNVDNITYDMALSDSFVWTASKGGGLRRHAFAADYTDYNDTTGWRVMSPLHLEDGRNLPFHPGDNTDGLIHRAFAVMYAESALYVGTAAGILRSSNEGRTWRSITARNSGLTGNFITAFGYQEATRTIWAATWRAEALDEYYGVSSSSDGGVTWQAHFDSAQVVHAIGHTETIRAHGFGFDGATMYVCDDIGLWKSNNGGATWDLYTQFIDPANGHSFAESQIYSAYATPSTLFVGGTDGLAASYNGGASWTLYQAATPVAEGSRPVDTYAYPCPWSPQRFGPVKLRYTTSGGAVKITVYDFAMSKVVELPTATRPSGEQYEIWDGKKHGTVVSNGTYFYKIEKPGGDVWGKLIVLD